MKLSNTLIIIGCLVAFPDTEKLYGQLSGNSISEYQLGNIPEYKPDYLSTLYNQLNLNYRYKGLNTSARIEQFYANDSTPRDYLQLSQWQVNYRQKGLDLKAGNFYETLGRGLLFRSFEIPASIKEERFYRIRQGFYRDIQGASIKYSSGAFRLKALYGKPLQNTFPPGSEYRRTETLEAVQPEFNIKKQTLGTILMRHSALGKYTLYSSSYIQGSLPYHFSYYGEYARNLSDGTQYTDLSNPASYGTYLSLNHSLGGYGASLEYKSYRNLLIGSGISDPPTLVREQSYRLLNRSTHLTELRNEQGYQLEVFYSFPDNKMLTFNHAWAENSMLNTFHYQEWFLEYYWPLPSGSSLKVFQDFSSDEIIRENLRYSGGMYYTQVIQNDWSLALESEAQHINRNYTIKQSVTNLYFGLILSRGAKLSLSGYYEFSDDPIVADRIATDKIEKRRHFWGLGASYRPTAQQAFQLFMGERRGGPACTSGVCYEVLDFKGIEFRWTTKF